MADNSIDLVVSKVAFDQLERLLNEIKLADAAITALNVNAGKAQATPSGAEGNSAANAALIAQMKSLTAEIDKQAAQIQKLSEAKKTYSRAVTQESVDITLRNQKAREAFKATSDEIDNYQRLDAAYKKAVKSAQDLGAQYGANSKQFLTAANAAKELDTKLKAIDSAVGKYGRNVGNYASGWNGLANSVNQLTREAPAFANSLNTGFMALSNNIPILADEINNLKIKNQELAASGKPTVSVTKSLISAFFSWQTALSVGVALLTVYGGKLLEYVFNTNGAKESTDRLTKSLKDQEDQLNKNIKQIEYQGEIDIQLAKKRGASDQELLKIKRHTGVLLVSEYEKQYNAIVAKIDSFDSYELLRAQDKGKALVFLQKKYNGDLVKARNEYIRRENAYTKENRDLLIATRAELLEKLKNQNDKNVLDGLTAENDLANKKTRIRRERLKIDFSEEKSAFDLRIALLEKERQLISDRINSYKISSQERLALEADFQDKTYELELLNLAKTQKLSEEKGADDKKKNDLALRNKDIDYAQHAQNIKDIDNRVNNEKLTAQADFNKKVETLDANSLKNTLAYSDKINKQQSELTVAQIEAAITANKLIADDAVKNEEQVLEKRQEAFDTYIKLTKDKIEIDKAAALAAEPDPIAREKIVAHYAALAKALDNIKSPVDNANQALKDLAVSFATAFSSSSISPTFLKMFEGNDSLFKRIQEGSAFTAESWKADTNQMMEAAQEMYNFISSTSQANFDAEYERLSKQKEVAMQFAGESDSAKKKVEEDYEKRRKQIAEREFKSKKQQSIVNIAIDTAQAIIGAIAKSPLTLGMPWAAIIAAMGAVQIGVVASQKVPQYFEGTDNHPGGLALINDGNGANYKETVVTPDGKVRQYSGRDVLIDAPAGTQVFTHDQWNNELNTMMREKGISMSNSFNSKSGLSYAEMDSIIAKHFSKITTQSTTIDKNGFNTFVSKGNSRTIRNQSRYSGTGFSV